MIVVPREVQSSGNVALAFIDLTFGTLSGDDDQSKRILSAFMAVSSFGNIVVMTFTAARGTENYIIITYLVAFANTITSQTRDRKRRNFTMGKVRIYLSVACCCGSKVTNTLSSTDASTGC
jgi:hypothetical protein